MIYFIRTDGRPYVKIGYCRDDAASRMAGLQVGSVDRLALIGTADGEPADERNWHARFDYLRVRGEWFEFTPELQRAIGLALGHHLPTLDATVRETDKALAYLDQCALKAQAR